MKDFYAFELLDKIADGLCYAQTLFFVSRAQTAQLYASVFNHFHRFPNALCDMQIFNYIIKIFIKLLCEFTSAPGWDRPTMSSSE